eukprot:3498566-Amphidinium_carterae.1
MRKWPHTRSTCESANTPAQHAGRPGHRNIRSACGRPGFEPEHKKHPLNMREALGLNPNTQTQ